MYMEYAEIDAVESDIFCDFLFEFYVLNAKYAILQLIFGDVVLKNFEFLNFPQEKHV